MPASVYTFNFSCVFSRDCILSTTTGFRKSLYLCSRECQIAAVSSAVFKDIILSLISEPDVFSLLKERKIPCFEQQGQYFCSLVPFYRQSFLFNLEDFRTFFPSGLSFQINSTFCARETIVWGWVCLFWFLILEIKALMIANIAPSASPFVRNSFFCISLYTQLELHEAPENSTKQRSSALYALPCHLPKEIWVRSVGRDYMASFLCFLCYSPVYLILQVFHRSCFVLQQSSCEWIFRCSANNVCAYVLKPKGFQGESLWESRE